VALVGVLGTLSFAAAQETAIIWSEPVKLGDGWWQSITVDRTGTAYIGWYGVIREEENGAVVLERDLLMYTRRDLDGTFSTPVDIFYTGDGGYTVRNAFGVTAEGRLHTYLRAGAGHVYSSALSSEAQQPEAWAQPRELIGGYYLDFLVDSQDVLHAVSSGSGPGDEFNESEALVETASDTEGNCIQCFNLYYFRSDDGGRNWDFPQKLTLEKAGADKVDIWEGVFSGRLYIDWNGGQDWYRGRGGRFDGRFVYSDDDGLTWSPEIVLTGAEDTLYQVTQLSVTEMRDDALMAVWHYHTDEDQRIYYQISQDLGETWTEPQIIPEVYRRPLNTTVLDDYELVTDLSGTVHLFAVARLNLSDESSLFHLEYRQGQWRRPQSVFAGSVEQRPEWPQAAIGPQNDIHLTWFIRLPSTDERRLIEVFYSRRTPTLPNRPFAEFEPTLTPTAIVLPAPAPTLTPFPTVQPIDTSASVTTTSDLYAIQTLLGGCFAAALICGGVLVATGFRPRR
jgi:hypothetical protein